MIAVKYTNGGAVALLKDDEANTLIDIGAAELLEADELYKLEKPKAVIVEEPAIMKTQKVAKVRK
jgi:hypothetical protein